MRYGGRHRQGAVRQVPYEEALSRHLNAVDRDGVRYTTHAFAARGDWWLGARILTPACIQALKRDGKLPLREVVIR